MNLNQVNNYNLFIIQGVSGSGKSFIAKNLKNSLQYSIILSTDELWYEDGIYKFDYKLLGEKHRINQQLVEEEMNRLWFHNIIVDNTNITQKQAQPYIDLAKKYDYNVTVIRVTTPIEVCKSRNSQRPKDRQVPENVIDNQFKKMENIVV